MRCTALISAALSIAMLSASAATKPQTAEFVSGTIKTIPANTAGALDANSDSELRFHYGNSIFAIAYQRITNAQVVEPSGHHLWKVPVPSLGKGTRLISISFRDAEGNGMVTFRAPASDAKNIARAIEQHRGNPATLAARKPAKAAQETWWGDKYWKTTRNKDRWPSAQPSDSPGTPAAGTK
jgi:hypothetical protein